MFVKYAKRTGAETPRFRKGTPAPRPLCPERPCLVDDKPATFHRWVEEDKVLLKLDYFAKPAIREETIRAFFETGVADASSRIEKVRQITALVEYPDGSVGRVKPELITFLDRRADHE